MVWLPISRMGDQGSYVGESKISILLGEGGLGLVGLLDEWPRARAAQRKFILRQKKFIWIYIHGLMNINIWYYIFEWSSSNYYFLRIITYENQIIFLIFSLSSRIYFDMALKYIHRHVNQPFNFGKKVKWL